MSKNLIAYDKNLHIISAKKHVVCYLASWAVYRTDKGKHKISNIKPKLCTHFIYSFTGLSYDGKIETLDPDYDVKAFKNFITLREKNPCAKFLIAIGGWNQGSAKFSYMSETPERREIFVDSVMRFLIHYDFDGLDLDWEYPAQRGGINEDKKNLNELLKLLKNKFASRKKILTIAIPSSTYSLKQGYDIENMCKNVDFVSVMAYDMNVPNEASVHAPLKLEKNEKKRETIDDVIKFMIKEKCPANKIILGITSVAKTFTLKKSNSNDIGAPITALGTPSNYLKAEGSLGFNEMCTKFEDDDGWTHKHMKNNAVKISYKDHFWAVYDDETTVEQRGQYVLDNKLAGLMFWSIDTDDFYPECHKAKYPLLVAANKVFKN
ncbi:endochitinase-like [Condylostylus longicornis]|uniref:endochitinase-like n=1 Tax=Condylostylus longicornis TaxID=2530218 RepID=UPI00244DC0E5|nr:endochitinase-like [Condylostylus longicornis]